MRHSLYTKIIATTISLSMLFGLNISVYADMAHEPDGACAGATYTYGSPNPGFDGKHNAVCSVCGNTVSVSCTPVGDYSTVVENRTHSQKCSGCNEYVTTGSCTLTSYIHKDGTSNHNMTCSVCNHVYEEACIPISQPIPLEVYGYEKHGYICVKCNAITSSPGAHIYGADGKCTECGYRNHSSSPAPAPTPAADNNNNWSAIVEEAVKTEEKMPASSFISAEAVASIPADVKASIPAGNTYNLTKITTTQGFASAITKIAKDNPAATSVSVYSTNPIAFNATSANAVSNSGKDFVYTFMYKGSLWKVTIPAGAKINLNGNMFAGPLYIGAQFGTVQVLR